MRFVPGIGAVMPRIVATEAYGKLFVSIIIPCRNEEGFIGNCLESILANDYPKDRCEVLVVDGMSDDGTRAIVRRYSREHPFIKLLDNPKKTTPAALNLGIVNANGDIVLRMDAHSTYPPHFISTSVEYLAKTDAQVVGGPIITVPSADTLVAKAIALATSHPFGVGNSAFRTSQRASYVDTVPFGAYRRDVFREVGLFDERLVRNQDNELNSRIIKAGGKIYLTPALTAQYYNQSTVRGLLRQALNTGMWNVATLRINPAAFRWRHFVPFVFVATLLTLGSLSLVWPGAVFLLLAVLGLYAAVAGGCSLQIGLRRGLRLALMLPSVFFIYHLFYGLGTFVGLFKMAVLRLETDSESMKGRHGKA